MNSLIQQIEVFDVHSDTANIGTRWKKWISRFDNFLIAANITDDERRTAMLLHCVGESAYDIFVSLPDLYPEPTQQSTTNNESQSSGNQTQSRYEKTKQKFANYFMPKVNTEFEIYNFRQANQEANESLDQYYARLLKLSTNCNFSDKDREIKSQIILGTSSSRLRRFALKQQPTLSNLLDEGRAYETTEHQVKMMEHPQAEVARINNKNPNQGNVTNKSRNNNANNGNMIAKRRCNNCGGNWHENGREACPALKVNCNFCHKKGHYAKVCMANKNKQNKPQQNYKKRWHRQKVCQNRCEEEESHKKKDSDASEESFRITVNRISETPKATINLNNIPVNFTVDTGTSVNIISQKKFEQFNGKIKLEKTGLKIYPYNSKQELQVVGKFTGTFKHKEHEIKDDVIVVDGGAEALLSYNTAKNLQLLRVSLSIKTKNIAEIDMDYIEKKLPNLLKGVGKLKNHQIRLHIDKEIQPVAQKHRRIPFHLRKRVEEEIRRLENEDIIEKAKGPTPWVSPVVIVPRPSDPEAIRMCIDMRAANKAIKRERHLTPTIDDIILQLNGATTFSKIDLKDGFHQLTLDAESREITTFSTHVGLFRYKRLNFGINSATEVFQDTIRQVLVNISGVLNICDDILIYGKTVEEHNKSLLAVLNRLNEVGLTINKKKCEFTKSEIKFFGYVFSKDGLKPDKQKIEAFSSLEPPTNQSEVRSLLGMLNYIGKFMPGLASNTQPLRELILKEKEFEWKEKHQNAFDRLKKQLTNANKLAYFDIHKGTHVHVDAGPVGVGAILSQTKNEKTEVVAYASRSLTKVEQRYSQIEKEMLAVSWALQHFHVYLYGTHFYVHTDHKPLVSIIQNVKSATNARIERLCLKIQQYDFTVLHQKGINNPSDYLSRHPISYTTGQSKKVERYVNFIVKHTIPKTMSTEEVRKATKEDKDLTELIKALETNKEYQIPKQYKQIKHELSIVDGIVLKGTKIILPQSLQHRAIDLAHLGHMGIVRTKQLLRTKVWFPKLEELTENKIKNCCACQASTGSKQRDPIQMTSMANTPFECIAIDFVGPYRNGKYVLVIQDEFSRYPLAEIVNSTNFESVKKVLEKVFATFGIPRKCKSDNGPPFSSREFAEFSHKYDFKHHRITPYWPEANGQAERFARTLSKNFICAQIETNDFMSQLDTFLFNYRSTPHASTNKSPFEIIFNWPVRSFLPSLEKKLTEETKRKYKQAVDCDNKYKEKQKKFADKKRHTKHHGFKVGDFVLCKQHKTGKLTPPFDPNPFKIIKISGTKVIVRRGEKVVSRNASFFKTYYKNKDESSFSDNNPSDYEYFPIPKNTTNNEKQNNAEMNEINPNEEDRESSGDDERSKSSEYEDSDYNEEAEENIDTTATTQRPVRIRRRPEHFKNFVMYK